ncbi:DUF2332 domain-containing protein [Mesobacterium pallidum]|uniref:DUF2332 domain-containing protein n=1 Tax=Mesobacterium pallidum TaxID=2872037 RepID=UPI001EE38DAD|nr:DUF2332 domain-containing protein [Mesobacterium pallidum]
MAQALQAQAEACASLGSPFMGRLLTGLADHWSDDLPLAARFEAWPGEIGASGHSLPLRLAGGLHALVLTGADPELAAVYPPNTADDERLTTAALLALHRHAAFLDDWVGSPPQTNEIRRCAALLPAASWLSARFGLPLRLSEMGASGGLNLMFDRYAMTTGQTTLGAADPVLTLTPDWRGAEPPAAPITVSERRGVDLNPLDPHDPENALRLQAYLWPDQPERLARTRAAIAAHDAPLDRGDAAAWLDQRLAQPWDGACHMVFSTIAFQYFPDATKARITAAMQAAGAQASDTAPLAWVAMEPDDVTPGAALTLRLWPGDHAIPLGRADFHGRWIDWQAPAPRGPLHAIGDPQRSPSSCL